MPKAIFIDFYETAQNRSDINFGGMNFNPCSSLPMAINSKPKENSNTSPSFTRSKNSTPWRM